MADFSPVVKTIEIKRGTDFAPLLIICRLSTGALVDLTGYIPFAEVRKQPHRTLILNLNPIITNAPAGQVSIGPYTYLQTREFTPGLFKWDFILQRPTGERTVPLIVGSFTISDIITEPA